MLTHLSIQGLAIVDSVQIDFKRGFNVITGETGAGKSILIKALSLLLGMKSNTDSIRKGFEHATVTGRFVIKDPHPALKLLEEWGVPTDDDEYGQGVIVRRQITVKGRSQSWVNDIPVTTTSLRQLAESLIDVFGQHDNHRLLDVSFHTKYLDEFLKAKDLPMKVDLAWRKTAEQISRLRAFAEDMRSKGRDSDYFSFRLRELKDFQPSPEDFDRASLLTERAKRSLTISAALQRASRALEDGDELSVSARLREVSKALIVTKLADLEKLADEATKISVFVDDLSYGIGQAYSQIDVSEEDVDQAEERIAGYQNLFRKHGVKDAASLAREWIKLEEQVSSFEDASGHVSKLLDEISKDILSLTEACRNLTTARVVAAKKIAQSVERELADLAMPAARFSVALEPTSKAAQSLDLSFLGSSLQERWIQVLDDWTSMSEHGAEKAQFYLASNAGEPSLALAKVASGGEVSRIMLALKKALAVGAETCVLVFDEIDTGISGRIADTVGQKIAELSSLCQIICISHLPQVAAYASAHYVVEKKVKAERTESNIRRLSETEHLEEIARLLSGNKVTEASLSHARNLVLEAQNKSAVKVSLVQHDDPSKNMSPRLAAAKRRKADASLKPAKHRS